MNIGTLHFEADVVGVVGKAEDAAIRVEIKSYANGKEYADHRDIPLSDFDAVQAVENRTESTFDGVDDHDDEFVFKGTNDAGHTTFGRVPIPQSLIPNTND